MTRATIGFAGMTHLGLVSAAAMAETGFHVVAFDADARRIAELRAGRLPVAEPGLDALVARHAQRGELSFAADPTALAACEVVYIAPDVPTDDAGGSDLAPLEALFDIVAGATHARTRSCS